MENYNIGLVLLGLTFGCILLSIGCILLFGSHAKLQDKVDRLDKKLAEHLALDDRYEKREDNGLSSS